MQFQSMLMYRINPPQMQAFGFIQANDKAGNKSESSQGQHSIIATLSKQQSSFNHSCYYWKSEVINASLSVSSSAPPHSICNTL